MATKILFQGDSITDCGRNTENGSRLSIGQGYAAICCAELMNRFPKEYEITNRAVSGSRIVDTYCNIKCNCWNLNPDILSILIGVNDVWHEISPEKNGVDVKRYENLYRMRIEETKERFPNIKMIIMEPFVLKSPATEEHWEEFRSEVKLRADVAKKAAEEYGLIFIPLQDKFDKAAQAINDASYYLADGVHPTPAGHRIIADAWLDAFYKNLR